MTLNRRLSGSVPRLGRTAVLAQIIAAVAFVVVLLAAEGVRLPFTGRGDWTLHAVFSDVGGIHSGERTPVLVAGVPVGQVTDVRLERGLGDVTMRLNSSARGAIRADATATIEPRSALQDLTIDVTPGSAAAPAAHPGSRIGVSQTAPTTTLDQVVSLMDTDTRAQLTVLLDQLARGIGGRGGTLQAAIAQLHTLLDPATQVAGALVRRRTELSELVASLSRLSQTADQHDAALADALSAGAQTLSVTASQQAAVSHSVRSLPSTVATLDTALRNVKVLSKPLVPTLSGLDATAAALPRALSSVRGVVPATSGLLSAADAFARGGATGLRAAAGVLGSLKGTATVLTPAISRIEPIVSAVNDHRQGIGLLGERFSGVLSTNDANGPILRGLGSFEQFNPADFGFPSASGAQRTQLATQAVTALTLTCLHGQFVACLVRYLVPGLPGSVR